MRAKMAVTRAEPAASHSWNTAGALATIAAGVAADGTNPPGNGALFRTPDTSRSVCTAESWFRLVLWSQYLRPLQVRWPEFQAAATEMTGKVNVTYYDCSAAGALVSPAGLIFPQLTLHFIPLQARAIMSPIFPARPASLLTFSLLLASLQCVKYYGRCSCAHQRCL